MRRAALLAIAAAVICLGGLASRATAGIYVVAQCSPGLYRPAPDAVFGRSSSHYFAQFQCNQGKPGLQVNHTLHGGSGTSPGAYGRWFWRAPAGTYITGGSVFANLRNQDGHVASIDLAPDFGNAIAAGAGDADGVSRTFGIPIGTWRSFVVQLACALQDPKRCGAGLSAHAYVKQVRLELTDVVPPTLALGGTMFAGGERRGPQSVTVSGVDQGSGVGLVSIAVNGKAAMADAQACNPLPGDLTARMQPCALAVQRTYRLDTALPPFHNGINDVQVCVFDYAQSESPNSDCDTRSILVNDLCPGSAVGGGRSVTATFAGTGASVRRARFGSRVRLIGRVRDSQGNGVPDAVVCVQVRKRVPRARFKLAGTTRTDAAGNWSYVLRRGPSRRIRVAYRDSAFEAATELSLFVRSRARLHLSRHRMRAGQRLVFRGRIPGPREGSRVIVIHGTVPGADRVYLIRRARTNALGHFRVGYRFAPVSGPTSFVFWTEVPVQRGYPYARGHSPKRYVRVYPKHH
jgi:hypothetical protein